MADKNTGFEVLLFPSDILKGNEEKFKKGGAKIFLIFIKFPF